MDEEDNINEVLSIQQRQKRAMIMRRNAPRIERAREIARKKMAPESNIRKRAYVKARQLIRRRVAGERGAEYEKLGPSEKMAIDRAVEGKQKMIKKLALRLIPKIKQAEAKRLQSFLHGKTMQNHGQPEGKTTVKEDINLLFTEAFPPYDTSSNAGQKVDTPIATNGKRMPEKGKSKNPAIIQHNKFQEEVELDSPAFAALFKKSEKSGIDLATLGEVYNRGWNSWSEGLKVTQEQYAFARVNSYINQGKTYFNEDADLHEGRAPGTPSIKRYKRPDGTTALKSLNKWGKRKDWRDTEGGLAKAREHAGVDTVTEEVEQIDELSWGTLHSYKRKAYKEIVKAHQQANKYRSTGRAATKPETKAKNAALEKAHRDGIKKREKGYDLAFAKMNPDTKGPGFGGERLPEPKITTKTKRVTEEVQQTNENFMDGKGPGKPGDSARHGLKGKSAAELRKIRSSETASPRKKQLAHWMLNMHHNEETELDEKRGLWDNIHAKRKRIAAGSGERMRKPGSKGAPTKQDFIDAQESVQEAVNLNSDHYKALTDIELNTKNRDMTTKNDGYGPLNPLDEKGSKKFWDEKAKMWNTTVEAAKEARCGNCAFFNQSPPVMKKIADGIGERGETVSDLAGFGFCELWEFKCAALRTCNTWVLGGPIKEETSSKSRESIKASLRNTNIRRGSLQNVERDSTPATSNDDSDHPTSIRSSHNRQQQIKKKIIDEEGNSQLDPKKRLVGTKELVKAYKKDTPGQSLDESFNIAFASGIGVTLTSKDLGMQAQGGFALHPSVIAEMEAREQGAVEEEVVSADIKGEVIPAHTKTVTNPDGSIKQVTVPGHVRRGKTNRKIIRSGNVTDGKPE